jgi:YjbE family integral membrane protein
VSQLSALVSVLIIDIVLAGDNAIVVAMAAASLPPERRRMVIAYGIGAALVLRIVFAFVAVELLRTVIGILFGGGLLLLWVCWKMYRELRVQHMVPEGGNEHGAVAGSRRTKTMSRAVIQIVLADLSMSLDNVLAVAGAARDHPGVLVLGLVVSVALMGVASNYLARLLNRYGWIAWVGLGIVTFVALRMIWDGSFEIARQTAML